MDRETLLQEVMRKGRFKTADEALRVALERYVEGFPIGLLDGPDDPAQRARALGRHASRAAAEIAALEKYLVSVACS